MAWQVDDLSENAGKIGTGIAVMFVALLGWSKTILKWKEDKRTDHASEQTKRAEDTRDKTLNDTIKYLEKRLNFVEVERDKQEQESSDWKQRCWAAEELARIENHKVMTLTARCEILEQQVAHMNGKEN